MSHKVRERAIFALLDGKLQGKKRADLESHLAECSACRTYLEHVKAGQKALVDLGNEPPPDVDWSKIDAALEDALEQSQPKPALSWPLLGTLAATAAAAFLLTVWLATDRQPPQTGEMHAQTTQTKTPPVKNDDNTKAAAPETDPLVAFVTFVAGQAQVSRSGEEWQNLSLDTDLHQGTSLRTDAQAAVGLQVSPGCGCRLEPETEVAIRQLDERTARLELLGGRVVCTSAQERQPIVVSVVDVVASATSESRFSVQRTQEVILIELSAGTVNVTHPQGERELTSPDRIAFGTDDSQPMDAAHVKALNKAGLGLLSRRSLASLQIPAADGIERVEVDDVDYGHLPLSLRRAPGKATVALYPEGGGDPIIHHLHVALGPKAVDIAALLPRTAPTTGNHGERRVGPRSGTLETAQIQRVRTQVGSQVRRCYERTLKRYPNVWGRIVVGLTITTAGEARNVHVKSVSGGHPAVNQCVQSSLSGTQFPTPRGGSVRIELPSTLSPRF